MYQVYDRLTSSTASLPISVVFSMDTEQLNEREKGDMERDSGYRLMFLPRRHVECYLIDPAAIAAMIISKDPSSSGDVNPNSVAAFLVAQSSDQQFKIAEWTGDLTSEAWQEKFDAAKLIGRVTSLMSNHRANFDKKGDSLGLVQHIMLHSPEKLRPLFVYIDNLVNQAAAFKKVM